MSVIDTQLQGNDHNEHRQARLEIGGERRLRVRY